MENKLSALFDYQHYQKNPALQAVIDQVHRRHTARQLSDDEADLVAAAGTPGTTLPHSELTDHRV